MRGELCDSYLIAGAETNYLHIRPDGGQICELDAANMSSFFEFIPASYKPQVPPGIAQQIFTVPAGCNQWCGPLGQCSVEAA